MSYSSNISDLNKKVTAVRTALVSVNNIQFNSWSGTARENLVGKLKDLSDSLEEELSKIGDFNTALAYIDVYDEQEEIKNSRQNTVNSYYNVPSWSDSGYSTYRRAYVELENAKNAMRIAKNNANNKLLNIVSGYNSKYNEIVFDDVISSKEIFDEILNGSDEINNKLDLGKIIPQVEYKEEDPTSTYSVPDDGEYSNSDYQQTDTSYSTDDSSSNNSTDSNEYTYDPSKSGSNGEFGFDKNSKPNFDNYDAWVGQNIYTQAGGLIGQCTWFACGRFYEMYGYSPGFRGNGRDCARQLVEAHPDKFYLSDQPATGAVFSRLSGQYGHVGVVLDVSDGYITYQDGNYNGQSDSFEYVKNSAEGVEWGTHTMTVEEFINKYNGQVEFANPY